MEQQLLQQQQQQQQLLQQQQQAAVKQNLAHSQLDVRQKVQYEQVDLRKSSLVDNRLQNNIWQQQPAQNQQYYTDINGFPNPNRKVRISPSFFSFMGQQQARPFNLITNEVNREALGANAAPNLNNVRQSQPELNPEEDSFKKNFSELNAFRPQQPQELAPAASSNNSAALVPRKEQPEQKTIDTSLGNQHNYQDFYSQSNQRFLKNYQAQLPQTQKPYGAPYNVQYDQYKKPALQQIQSSQIDPSIIQGNPSSLLSKWI